MPRPAAEPSTIAKAHLRVRTRDAFAAFCRAEGLIQADVLGDLIEWFMALDATSRALVLDRLDAGDRDAVARLVLQRLAENGAKGKAKTSVLHWRGPGRR